MKVFKISIAVIIVVLCCLVFFHQKLISIIILPQYIEWAAETEVRGLQVGVALNEQQLLIAREIGIQDPQKVRLVYVDEVPFPRENAMLNAVGEALGFIGEGIINNAQVFGYSIYVRKGYPLTIPNLAHELVHVLQIERSSLAQVITQHFADLVAYGYDDSPLEVEAFKANERYRGR